MNQEPVLIKGVVAFPNPNGNREIRFIDAFYHDLFKIPDHSSIVINYLDGGKRCVPCEYIDDTHVDTQCFQELYYRADEKYNGRLPVPVRVIQDEWANVAQPDSYPKILATCRSYNIGLNIIVQNIQNIKALYEKEWEGIIGNCDTLLFLGGGNEPTSLEFMSKLLGKETLDTRTRGQTKGRNGSSSTNYQQAGRELMMIDEIRMMDTDDAILLIRGEKPVLDKKYDITRHPNFKKSAAGGAEPYVHKPQEAPDYALPDLPYEFHALDDYDFIEMEDSQNEQEE
ncbi:type IV secretory system conjugative DNA transfer family protein [Oscillibacter valericigenes]|uniref:type IV secretory system conjugative DNA transfer family protein n=1 Tax=Oscillibacter valericigenes TaxID=351091 RepID=UPI001F283F4A|nr:TraG/TraD/VirD4 family protein [Oscillibacter valericigenes]